jgi:hypothetical protein
MASLRVSASRRVNAPADVVYRLIADYRNGHPRIVPPKYFSNLVVEEGGYGAGTRFFIDMTVLGNTERMRATVEEPRPGRLLLERDLDRGIVTTFEVVPDGEACNVTITTEFPRRRGLRGVVERFIVPRVLPKIYQEEMAQMEAVAQQEPMAKVKGQR